MKQIEFIILRTKNIKLFLCGLILLFNFHLSVSAMSNDEQTKKATVSFLKVLRDAARRNSLENVCDWKDDVERRILREYGSVFSAAETVLPPSACIFTSAEQVGEFQKKAGIARILYENSWVELQPAAAEAMQKAREEAQLYGLEITPKDGAEAGRRSFDDTMRLWNTRFQPACDYWEKMEKLLPEDILHLKSLPVKEQIKAVLEQEKQGVYFNTFFNNSILYSVAAPGTSQHLSMLAFDAVEADNPQVREILARHGWYRTVRNDSPHFTYLGRPECDLPSFGLVKISARNGDFWVPNV